MRRTAALGALALGLGTMLGGCALVEGGGFVEDYLDAQSTMTELSVTLLENPDVLDAGYELAPYLVGRNSVTVSLVDDASDATWLEVVEAIDAAVDTEELDEGVDVEVGTSSGLSLTYPADTVDNSELVNEVTAGLAIQRVLASPLSMTLSRGGDGFDRTLQTPGDQPAATAALSQNRAELDELTRGSAAETTRWIVPGVQAFDGLPPEGLLVLVNELGASLSLHPADAAPPAQSVGISWFEGSGWVGIITTESGDYAKRPGWSLVVAAARFAVESGEPVGLQYNRYMDGDPEGGSILPLACAGELQVLDEDRALAAALADVGIIVPGDRLGTCLIVQEGTG